MSPKYRSTWHPTEDSIDPPKIKHDGYGEWALLRTHAVFAPTGSFEVMVVAVWIALPATEVEF